MPRAEGEEQKSVWRGGGVRRRRRPKKMSEKKTKIRGKGKEEEKKKKKPKKNSKSKRKSNRTARDEEGKGEGKRCTGRRARGSCRPSCSRPKQVWGFARMPLCLSGETSEKKSTGRLTKK